MARAASIGDGEYVNVVLTRLEADATAVALGVGLAVFELALDDGRQSQLDAKELAAGARALRALTNPRDRRK